MVDDTVTLLELLRDRFGGKTFVTGFSFGATFAAYAAVQRPELVAALVAAGMDIEAAQRFHDSLTAPSKRLVWFERSAHAPHLEEPAKFRQLLMDVRASQLAST